MHLLMILMALAIALGLRQGNLNGQPSPGLSLANLEQRWRSGIIALVAPVLLLLTTAIAVLSMGAQGQMVWQGTGLASYFLAWLFLLTALACFLHQGRKLRRTLAQLRQHPKREILGYPCRILDDTALFSAQVGGWNPELTITQGLLDHLDGDRLAAVLAHEEGHRVYRDTFWFFWLGICYRLTLWLPQSDLLWQDLLLLREIRADAWAAQQVDELLLAESLLDVVRAPLRSTASFEAAFSCTAPPSRLEQRIEALLYGIHPGLHFGWQGILQLAWVLLPLTIIPFHH
ncbi:MAG: M56 family peptidase [Phormidium sp. GEM2.Bin31]|nr:MAG: M56 family peptidase [Phormidium sp. GEM2.Bin31]